MNTHDLRFVADALLAIVGQDEKAPFELDSLVRRHAMSAQGTKAFVQMAANRRPDDQLLANECREVYERASLTKNQAEVLDMRLMGLSFEQIGRCKRSTRQGAMQVFLHAIKKIGRVMRVYPYVGLSDVYRSEVRRGL